MEPQYDLRLESVAEVLCPLSPLLLYVTGPWDLVALNP